MMIILLQAPMSQGCPVERLADAIGPILIRFFCDLAGEDMTDAERYEQTLLAIDEAAAEGNHATLESLYQTARPLFTDQLCAKLAWAGQLDTLKFMRSLTPPAPLSAMCLTLAVQEQQTCTVAWLLKQGCPCDGSVYDA